MFSLRRSEKELANTIAKQSYDVVDGSMEDSESRLKGASYALCGLAVDLTESQGFGKTGTEDFIYHLVGQVIQHNRHAHGWENEDRKRLLDIALAEWCGFFCRPVPEDHPEKAGDIAREWWRVEGLRLLERDRNTDRTRDEEKEGARHASPQS